MRTISVSPELKEEAEQFVSDFQKLHAANPSDLHVMDFETLTNTVSFILSAINEKLVSTVDEKVKDIESACQLILQQQEEPDQVSLASSSSSVYSSSSSSDDEIVDQAVNLQIKEDFVACLTKQKETISIIKNNDQLTNLEKAKGLLKAVLHILLTHWINRGRDKVLSRFDSPYIALATLSYDLNTYVNNYTALLVSQDCYWSGTKAELLDMLGLDCDESSNTFQEGQVLDVIIQSVYIKEQSKILVNLKESLEKSIGRALLKNFKSKAAIKFFKDNFSDEQANDFIVKIDKNVLSTLYRNTDNFSSEHVGQSSIIISRAKKHLTELEQVCFAFLQLTTNQENLLRDLVEVNNHDLSLLTNTLRESAKNFLNGKIPTIEMLQIQILNDCKNAYDQARIHSEQVGVGENVNKGSQSYDLATFILQDPRSQSMFGGLVNAFKASKSSSNSFRP